MPNKGPAYPISAEWRRQVSDAIEDLKNDEQSEITSRASFARKAKIGKSSLTEALDDASIQSTVMPEINAALGWPAPRVLSTPDELELWSAVEALSDRDLGRLLGMAESTLARLRRRRG